MGSVLEDMLNKKVKRVKELRVKKSDRFINKSIQVVTNHVVRLSDIWDKVSKTSKLEISDYSDNPEELIIEISFAATCEFQERFPLPIYFDIYSDTKEWVISDYIPVNIEFNKDIENGFIIGDIYHQDIAELVKDDMLEKCRHEYLYRKNYINDYGKDAQ